MATWRGFDARSESQLSGKASLVRMLTVREVAAVLRVHNDTVRRWSNHKLPKTYRVGPRGDRRFRPQDVDSFLTHVGKDSKLRKPQKGKMLVVDDDYRVRDLLKNLVEEEGHEVIPVESGERVLEELEREDLAQIFWDLILTGLMVGKGGWAASNKDQGCKRGSSRGYRIR